MDNNFVNFAYIIFVTSFGKGYGCFAIRKLEKNKFRIASSFCNPRDANKFDKKRARMIASNRLNTAGCYVDISIDESLKDDFATLHHKLFSSHLNIPDWAMDAYYMQAYSLTLSESRKSYFQLVEELDLSYSYFEKMYKNNDKQYFYY